MSDNTRHLIDQWRREVSKAWDTASMSPDEIAMLERCADELEAATSVCARCQRQLVMGEIVHFNAVDNGTYCDACVNPIHHT